MCEWGGVGMQIKGIKELANWLKKLEASLTDTSWSSKLFILWCLWGQEKVIQWAQ